MGTEKRTWHDVVRACEEILGCDDTALSPGLSNLPNLVRDLKARAEMDARRAATDLMSSKDDPGDYFGHTADYLNRQARKREMEPPWIKIAYREIGTKEFAGEADNPDVVKYLQSVDSLSLSAQRNDETSWCSAFVNWCVEQAGHNGTGSAAARSWLQWGEHVLDPIPGCITVLWRVSPESWQGHVGFFAAQNKESVYLLGGNQADQVNITSYPRSRILGHRFLSA